MRIMTLVGTRPEVIRLSELIRRLDDMQGIEHLLVHTGQNDDPNLNVNLFQDLGLRGPDVSMAIGGSSLGQSLGQLMSGTESVLKETRPDAFVVLGDTNSALALIIAKRMRVVTYHLEAGNRCFDQNVPEETNRRLLDHTADFNLVYTEHARRNLLREGLEPRRIMLMGSPMAEVLEHSRDRIASSSVLRDLRLEPGSYILVSAHREENVDPPPRLMMLLECLNAVAAEFGVPVLVSTHPRTSLRVRELGVTGLDPRVNFHRPFVFTDYCHLQKNALCVLSDSGTIGEEAGVLGFPAVTLRSSVERPEALETGTLVMADLSPSRTVQSVYASTQMPATESPGEYGFLDSSSRVAKFILSTAEEHRNWAGIRYPPSW